MNQASHTSLIILAASSLTAIPGIAQTPGDRWLTRPVDDDAFETYLDFFAYDRDLPFEVQTIGVDEQEGVRVEHLSFTSTPAEPVFARLYRPVSAAGVGRPAILLLHGGIGAGKDSPGSRVLASSIVRAGIDILAIDLQHFGERKSGLLDEFTEEEKHTKLYNRQASFLAFVAQTVKDAGRSFDFLVERGYDPKQIGLVGFSRGAQLALIVGGADPRFAAVAALYAGHFDAHEQGHRAAACPANFIGRISPRPLFMVNGVFDDDYDKDTSVLPLQRLANEPKTIHWAETGHEIPPLEYRQVLVTWLRDRL